MASFRDTLVFKGLSPNSIRLATSRVDTFKEWLGKRDFNQDAVVGFIGHLKRKGLKNSSINSYIFALRHYATFTETKIELRLFPKTKKHIEILTPDEINAILNTHIEYGMFRGRNSNRLDRVYTALTRLLATTGARFSEAVSLHPDDVGTDYVVFRNTKNGEDRRVAITKNFAKELRTISNHQHVFYGMNFKQVYAQDYSKDLRVRARMCGIAKRVHPHLFRHSFATELIKSGVDMSLVATIIGHKDIQTTYKNYLHLANSQLRKAVYAHPLITFGMPVKEKLSLFADDVKRKFDDDGRIKMSITEDDTFLSITLTERG